MIKKDILLCLWIVLSVLLSGCHEEPKAVPTLRIGHAPHDHHSPLYIAAMNPDYFKQNGGVYLKELSFRKEYELIADERTVAHVLVDSNTGGQELIRRLSEEQFDVSFGGVPAILQSIDRGRPVRMMTPIMAEGAGLVVRNAMPVDSWDEFVAYVQKSEQPVKIGYKSAVSVQNLIFEAALTELGISFGKAVEHVNTQVQLINLNGAKHLIPAMENRLIDGFVVMQPFLAMAETSGVGKTVALLRELPPAGRWHGHPCCALAANERFLEEQPEVAQRLLPLLLRARKFIGEYPEQSAQQVAEWLGVSYEVEARSLPTIDFSVTLDDEWHGGVNYWVDAMSESGRLNGEVKHAHESGSLHELLYSQSLYTRACKELE